MESRQRVYWSTRIAEGFAGKGFWAVDRVPTDRLLVSPVSTEEMKPRTDQRE